MFTGIVEKTVPVIGVAEGPMFRRLTLAGGWDDLKVGQSVAVNGVCLTASDLGPGGQVGFDVIAETLGKTNLGLLQAGDVVNVERSLRAGDRVDGHFVQGHVDGTAALVDRLGSDKEYRLRLQAPPPLGKYLVPKGSVTIDGVSLTLAEVGGLFFEVALIPTTLSLTTLGRKRVGWLFNLEADVLAKTVVTYLERMK